MREDEGDELRAMADGAERMFEAMAADRLESIPGAVIGHDADGRGYVLPLAFSDAEEKAAFFGAAREAFKVHGVVRYMVLTEAWVTRVDMATGARERREAGIVVCRSRHGSLLRTYAIERDAQGRIARLTKEGDDQDAGGQGILSDLLPDSGAPAGPRPNLRETAVLDSEGPPEGTWLN